ncbi:mitochondrial distribution and morphology protein 10 [Dichotomopilus funicola]|uniref:Mitochondrial distribution and morphology protein 10 n=1 Tax=Dichotomopilus funicola TaxID=1934379 RepID=A0AAN6UZ40_9PEZI|nr:mitochondrial distribution and morphology protein 10 [Dichotomopilus funicola]
MREFMHYITNAFYGATGWNDDNTYKELNVTARELIDFPLPRGLRLTLSSLATPHFATSYQLGSIGVVDGSISYLHSTVPLTGVAARSDHIPLPTLLRSYRRLHDLGSRNTGRWGVPKGEGVVDGVEDQCGDSLFYGRLYLPQSLLEGLVVRRFSADLQVQLSAVSERSLRNGGTLLGLIQYDRGKYGIEGLASTDGGLLGFRGLYNFGGDASPPRSPIAGTPVSGGTPTGNNGSGNDQQTAATERERDRIYGRFSAGGEVYYGTLNKSGGTSLGLRFATLPTHRGTPLTTTLTINPLMGNISATYAVLARDYCSLATRMEFNVYSYESEWAVGMELWSNRRPAGFLLGADPRSASAREEHKPQPSPPEPSKKERSFQAKLEWRLDEDDDTKDNEKEAYRGVLKARLDQNLRIGLLWEGRVKSLIFSLGSGIDLRKLDEPFRSLGMEIQFSS